MTRERFDVNAMFRLDGKVAFVSGGSGLYGTPISRALAQAGATVIIASRNRERCEERAQEFRTEGLDCESDQFDMGDAASIDALHARIVERHGGVDILVNNAVGRSPTYYDEATPEQWAEANRVNVTGIQLCTRTFSQSMIQRGGGCIINISSIYGCVAPDFRIYEGLSFASPPDYAFHKGGLIQYTRYCATYFAAQGIRVNCISPGGYLAGQADVFQERYNNRIPLGRMATDADIAGPVVFLASDAARYITGINLMVDGGLTAW